MINEADPIFKSNFCDEVSGDGLVTSTHVLVRKIVVLESPSAATTLTNGASGETVIIIPASTAVGTVYDLGDVQCVNGLYWNDNSHTTGQINVIAKKYVQGI